MFSKKKGTATKTADYHEAKAEVIVQVRKYLRTKKPRLRSLLLGTKVRMTTKPPVHFTTRFSI